MKRSFLFVGAKPARRARAGERCDGGGRSTSASAPPLHLRDRARHERADAARVLGRDDEVGEEPGGDAVLERVADDRDAGQLASPIRAEAAVVARRVEVAPVEVRGVARRSGCRTRLPHAAPSASRSAPKRSTGRTSSPSSGDRESGSRIPPCSPARPSTYRATPPRAAAAPTDAAAGRSIQPSRRMKIGYDSAFGKVTVSGEPDGSRSLLVLLLSVENTPCPR